MKVFFTQQQRIDVCAHLLGLPDRVGHRIYGQNRNDYLVVFFLKIEFEQPAIQLNQFVSDCKRLSIALTKISQVLHGHLPYDS